MNQRILFFLIVVVVAALPLFLHLEDKPIRQWDEARQAVNAIQVLKTGDWITMNYIDGPEMWSTKPSLLVWCQVVSVKFFGIRELSFRMPSVMSALITCLLLAFFLRRLAMPWWTGIAAVTFLVSSPGYILEHAARSADFEAMLTLFTTASVLLFYAFLTTGRIRYYHWFFLALFLGFMTKGIQVFFFVPALLMWTIFTGKATLIFRNKWSYIDTALVLAGAVGYYFLRNVMNPGYFHAVWNNEMGGRFLKALEEHHHKTDWYLSNLLSRRLVPFVRMLPVALLLVLLTRSRSLIRLTLYAVFCTITYFLVISMSETKLEWYDVPLYPLFAIWLACGVVAGVELTKRLAATTGKMIRVLWLTAAFSLLGWTWYSQLQTIVYPPNEEEDYFISCYLRDAIRAGRSVDEGIICNEGYDAHLWPYLQKLAETQDPPVIVHREELQPGQIVLAAQKRVREYIDTTFEYREERVINTSRYFLGKRLK